MFEKKLKSLLESHNLSVNELSKRTGVPKTTIQQWLTGTNPNLNQLDIVASYFKITIDELAFGRKPKTSLEAILDEVQIHTGVYRVSISKLVKNDNDES